MLWSWSDWMTRRVREFGAEEKISIMKKNMKQCISSLWPEFVRRLSQPDKTKHHHLFIFFPNKFHFMNSIYKTNFSLSPPPLFPFHSTSLRTLTPTSRSSLCFECQITTIGFIVSHPNKAVQYSYCWDIGISDQKSTSTAGGKNSISEISEL